MGRTEVIISYECHARAITAFKELKKRCFCLCAVILSYSFIHILLPHSSLLFFSTLQYSSRIQTPTVSKYTHSEFQPPKEKNDFISNIESWWRTVVGPARVRSPLLDQLTVAKKSLLYLNCSMQSYHQSILEGGMLVRLKKKKRYSL